MSSYREKQGRQMLSRQPGCDLISLPDPGEAPRGAICQAARTAQSRPCVLVAPILAGPQHAQEALVSPCSDFLMDKHLPGS